MRRKCWFQPYLPPFGHGRAPGPNGHLPWALEGPFPWALEGRLPWAVRGPLQILKKENVYIYIYTYIYIYVYVYIYIYVFIYIYILLWICIICVHVTRYDDIIACNMYTDDTYP